MMHFSHCPKNVPKTILSKRFWNFVNLYLSSTFTAALWAEGGVESKVNQGACYWVWNLCDKILACLKKDPSCVRKHPEQHFLRHNLKFFLEFQKKFCFATSVTFKITIKNYFLVKKVWKKKLPIKFAEKFCQKKS